MSQRNSFYGKLDFDLVKTIQDLTDQDEIQAALQYAIDNKNQLGVKIAIDKGAVVEQKHIDQASASPQVKTRLEARLKELQTSGNSQRPGSGNSM